MVTRKSIKNNNRNDYNTVVEEEQKKNNFVDVAPTSTNNFHEE